MSYIDSRTDDDALPYETLTHTIFQVMADITLFIQLCTPMSFYINAKYVFNQISEL